MSRPYPVATVANALLKIAWHEGGEVSPMKLQKLVYLAHGLSLAMDDKRLIDSTVEAWKYGPVVSPLYYETRHYGSEAIVRPIKLESVALFSDGDDNILLDGETHKLLIDVWRAYGTSSAVSLSALTHRGDLPEGEPWYETWHNKGGKEEWGTDIPNEVIKASFKKLLVNT